MPVEAVPLMFARHPLWGRVMGDKARQLILEDETKSAAGSASKLEGGSDKDGSL